MKYKKSAVNRNTHPWPGFVKAGLLALMMGGGLSASLAQAQNTDDTCGYSVTSGTLNIRPNGYRGWVELKNINGETATDFEVLLDLGAATITQGQQAEYEQIENGYWVTAPSNLKNKTIRLNSSHRFQFNATLPYEGVKPYLISINGTPCDMAPPQVTLNASDRLIVENSTLLLTANAQDNAGIRYVEFKKNGQVIATDWQAPYQLELDITEAANGLNIYSAVAYDPSGNSAGSAPQRVFVSIGNRYFGTAPGGPATYEHLLTYFNQLTPENAGKWGSVASQRGVMNWSGVDTAYQFARDNQIAFRYHNLVWGEQQPAWLDTLSSAEQLAEVDNWMRQVAQRYPDLELVEVVNEPLHAPPSYIQALGGSGVTGWDWVITAFEMARKHFPKAQLTLNDYQILHLPVFTQEYLEIINLLNERNLIDAISVQGHFLERADVPLVAANLDSLAATGLPIYVSEFDLNFADDARHANVFRDLFTVFWEHPSVVGVTHWGHLEGTVWRPNAYLVREDGTPRPALEWVMCYLDGGSNCYVPEYVPTGWQGNQYGLSLEAEEFDAGEGLLAVGDVVAYTDDGDWMAFHDVEFQGSWDVFSIAYAKGNQSVGNISVHLGSLDSYPVLTLELPPTAGWGSVETLEVPWNPLAGTYDVYIRFNNGYGIANVDRLTFGRPQDEPAPFINLVNDGGFEGNSLVGWQSWNGSALSLSTQQAYAGNQSMRASNRPDSAQFAVYSLTNAVRPGTTYSVSARALLDGVAPDTVRLAAMVQCVNPPAGHNSFPWLDNRTNVSPGQWIELSASLVIPDCEVQNVAIFFEGTSAGVDVYLDDVRVIPPAASPNLIPDGGFESGYAGWSAWNGSSLSLSSEQAFTGNQSLYITNRPNTAQYAVYNLTASVTPGTTYTVSAQALISGSVNDTVRLAAKIECANPPAGHNTYPWLQNNSNVTPWVWTEVSASLVIPDCDVLDVAIFFEGTSAGIDVYLDDVSVTAN